MNKLKKIIELFKQSSSTERAVMILIVIAGVALYKFYPSSLESIKEVKEIVNGTDSMRIDTIHLMQDTTIIDTVMVNDTTL